MTTYPLTTLAPTVDATGISAPSYPDILTSLQASFRSIYGSDVYLGADSQDGQLLAIFAKALKDSNDATVAVFNGFAPSGSAGAALSALVKLNGLGRVGATNSTADLTISGAVGTVINNGRVGDGLKNVWLLPSTVTIPSTGFIIATAVAEVAGAVTAGANTITSILTPTRGWQSVTNAAAATTGADAEQDGELRLRQAASTAGPSLTLLGALMAAVANLPGVTRSIVYENDGNSADTNGLPPHSIAAVVEGGDAQSIAMALSNKKDLGTYTYGTTSETVTAANGAPATIRFFRPTVRALSVEVDMTALAGYTATTGAAVVSALVAYIAALKLGDDVYLSKMEAVSTLLGTGLENTFNVTAVKIGFKPALGTADLVLAFNEVASLSADDIQLVIS